MALGPAGLVWLGLNLGGVVCSPTTGVVTFTGNIPTAATAQTGLAPHPLPWLGLNLQQTNPYVRSPQSGVFGFVGNIPTLTGTGSGSSPTTGVVTFTGNVSVVLNSSRILPSTGSVTFTGNQPSATWQILNQRTDHELPTHWVTDVGYVSRYVHFQLGTTVARRDSIQVLEPQPTTGEITFIGNVSEVIQAAYYATATTGEVEFNGGIPVLTLPVAGVTPTTGVVTFTGNVAGINTQMLRQPHAGEVTFTGYVPYLDLDPVVTPETGEFLFYGEFPSVDNQEQIVTAGEQTGEDSVITFTGNVPTVTGFVLTIDLSFPAPSGGWKRKPHKKWYEELPTPEEVQAEREALGILPKRAQKVVATVVDKATTEVTAKQAPLLAAAYLEEAKQRSLADDLRAKAAKAKTNWDDAIFTTTLSMILDELRKKSDREELERILLAQEHEEVEINEILNLWMNDL